jgi:lysophospholipase L1-like esterase
MGFSVISKWVVVFMAASFLIVCGCSSAFIPPKPVPPSATPAPQIAIFTGDSITQLWGENGNVLPIPGALDTGRGGDTTTLILSRFQSDVLAQKPSSVLILGGTNDMLFQSNSVQTAVANIESMINEATTAGVSHIFVGTVTPIEFDICPFNLCFDHDPNQQIQAFNSALSSMLAKHPGVIALDYHAAMSDPSGIALPGLFQDGVHPTPLGYSKMDAVVQKAISSMASE